MNMFALALTFYNFDCLHRYTQNKQQLLLFSEIDISPGDTTQDIKVAKNIRKKKIHAHTSDMHQLEIQEKNVCLI